MLGEGGQQLPQLIASPDLTVRLRALSLAVSLAATSPEAAAAIRQKGRLLMVEAAGRSWKLPHVSLRLQESCKELSLTLEV